MKETITIPKESIENLKPVEQKKQLQLIKKFKPQKGHTLFEINKVTGKVVKAEFEIEKEIHFDKAKKALVPSPNKKVIMRENCIYISALNIKNCFKKLGFVIKK